MPMLELCGQPGLFNECLTVMLLNVSPAKASPCLALPLPLHRLCPHRCLIDAKVTGSHSQFMPRSADYKLYFQVEAFRFQGQRGSNPIQPQKTKLPIKTASDFPATLDMVS